MFFKKIINTLILLVTLTVFSQENLYTSFTIPDNLRQNANAVVRLNDVSILLKSPNEMQISRKRIITVLNKEGNSNIDAYVHYDNNVKINELQVLVYNQYGALIKKIRKNDFKDVSAVDGGTLYTDSRVKFLEYTPIAYPYTVEFVCETTTNNTAFIPSFTPVNDYFLSVETSKYSITYPQSIDIRKKEKNIEGEIFNQYKQVVDNWLEKL